MQAQTVTSTPTLAVGLLTANEVATRLRVSTRTMRRYVAERQLEYVSRPNSGGRFLGCTEAQIDAFIRQNSEPIRRRK